MITCNECRYALFQDEGYSNYTVEGTVFYCLKKAHPADGFDRWYGEDKRLNHAQECTEFSKGDPVCMDVDGDDAPYTDDPEILDLLRVNKFTFDG